MSFRHALLAAVAAACGASIVVACVGDDPTAAGSTPDSGSAPDTGSPSPDGATGDAGADATAKCSRTSPFANVVGLNVNSPLNDLRGRLSRDLRTLVFVRSEDTDASSGLRLFIATRDTDDGDFPNVRKLDELAGPANTIQVDPSLTPDGLRLVYATTASTDGGGKIAEDIVEAIRPNTSFATAFGAPTRIAAVDTTSYDFHPYLNGDGTLLFFMSEPSDAGAFTMYQSARALDGTYAAPTKVTGPSEQIPRADSPVATSDGLSIYFRHGDGKSMSVARRMNAAAGFGQASPLPELDDGTATFQQPSWISDDECTILFLSDRAGGKGGIDLYVARRGP